MVASEVGELLRGDGPFFRERNRRVVESGVVATTLLTTATLSMHVRMLSLCVEIVVNRVMVA